MKTNIGDLVAQSMLNVLSSKEHARLFKKAYAEDEIKSSDPETPAPSAPTTPPAANAPGGDTNAAMCKACNGKGDCSMCGDSNMSESHLSIDDSDVSWLDSMMDSNLASDESTKKAHAAYSALEDLITASAALDYADLGKASELAVKLATLVAEAKKGKVSMKDSNHARAKATAKTTAKTPAKKAPAKKDEKSTEKSTGSKSTDSKSTGSTSSTSSKSEKSTSSTSSTSSKKPAKKMTMKERMEALRAKKK